ncbi:uncharacterized protein C8A04DRAFT_28901 [Dichotomopilus funicola]|uniref:Uncharacterized protein n=1 Tax=Dichotomopilus funicola TaxID=1934379 RepID=A0AAN6V2D2_9PEZI|nr:hypothetical protein C8A04DRAFT_28901 [Dichotomopilus funicola]
MEILEQARASVVHKFSAGGTLPQLPNEYQDVESLLEMAMSEQASAQDTLVLAIAALRRLHRYVETSWDHAFEGQRESNKFHLTQWEHMRQLYQRIRSIEHKVNNEGTGPSSAADASPGTDSSHTVFNVPNYRYEMLEQKVAQHDEVIQAVRREGHNANPSGDVMDRAVARMKHVSEVQAQDAMREFARADAARAAQVDGFADQLEEQLPVLKHCSELLPRLTE